MLCVRAWCVWMIAENQEKSLLENPQPAHIVIGIKLFDVFYVQTVHFPNGRIFIDT